MTSPDTTDWLAIRAAASGDAVTRDVFAHRYQDQVRERLSRAAARGLSRDEIDDAVQEVFVECFKQGGVLATANPERIGGFRAFLNGVIDNVARRLHERAAIRRKHVVDQHPDSQSLAPAKLSITPSQQMDRNWALAVLQNAAAVMRERAALLSPPAQRRVLLLELRFQQGLTIRDIATLWQVDAAVVHHQYAKAREEFRQALLQVVAAGRSLELLEVQAECERLLQMLAP